VSLSVHWFLPTAGDSRDVVGFGPTSARRDADLDTRAGLLAAAPGDAAPDTTVPPACRPALVPASAS